MGPPLNPAFRFAATWVPGWLGGSGPGSLKRCPESLPRLGLHDLLIKSRLISNRKALTNHGLTLNSSFS